MTRHPSHLLIVAAVSLAWELVLPAVLSAQTVDARLESDSAWAGEPVSMTITLYSPGPFSGTASFDLPELPRTTVLPSESPVVGNETVNGESLFTQRHQLKLFTQQFGQVVIPPFTVRFAGKKSFLAEAEPMQGTTPELSFESKRPPGWEQGVVMTVTEMTIDQTWSSDQREFQTGDVVQRTITRTAAGTTAMMFPPVEPEADDGMRTYVSTPTVEDTSERGRTLAKRVDTVKYQFERAGTFDVPSIQFTWWDPQLGKVQTQTLEGSTFTIKSLETVEEQADTPTGSDRRMGAIVAIVVVAGLVAWLARGAIARSWSTMAARRNAPQAVAARRLKAACRANRPRDAYLAWLDWKRGSGGRLARETDAQQGLHREVENLARLLFGANPHGSSWSGRRLLSSFDRVLQERMELPSPAEETLPALNPTSE